MLNINTNAASLAVQRNLSTSGMGQQTAMERLSSGLRINSAKDDAAGVAIADRMNAQVRGLNVASRNINDGLSLAQTAESALGKVSDSLQRIRELAVQSRNATNNATDRAALNTEAQQLKSEIDRVATTTQFNGVNLLDGSFTNKAFQVGANKGEQITMNSIVDASSTNLGSYTQASVTGAAATAFTAITAGDLTINGTSVGAVAADGSATARATSLRTAINSVSDTTGVYAVNDTATTVTLSSSSAITVAFAGASATTATTGLTAATTATTTTTGFGTLDLTTTAGADTAMTAMDAALTAVNTARSTMGAYQSRFEVAAANNDSLSTNLATARGRIVDTDFAKETAALTRGQVLQQAGTAMLSQANQLPNNVLSLLR